MPPRIKRNPAGELSLCLEGAHASPVADTLAAQTVMFKFRITPARAAATLCTIFILTVAAGKLSGHWQTSVTPRAAAAEIQNLPPD